MDLWGSNINEEDKIQNRRVRVLVDDNIPALSDAEPEPIKIEYEEAAVESGSAFPWKIVLLLLILAIIAAILFLLLAKKRKKPLEETAEPQKVEEPAAPPVITSESVVNLEEEIRHRAYFLHLERNDWNENVEEDWHRAVAEISARYQADGYQVYSADGTWWARKSFTQ